MKQSIFMTIKCFHLFISGQHATFKYYLILESDRKLENDGQERSFYKT